MIKTMAIAGAVSALLIGSIALAQTSSNTPSSSGADNGYNTPAATNSNSSNMNSNSANTGANTADQYGSNASATAGAKTGERG